MKPEIFNNYFYHYNDLEDLILPYKLVTMTDYVIFLRKYNHLSNHPTRYTHVRLRKW